MNQQSPIDNSFILLKDNGEVNYRVYFSKYWILIEFVIQNTLHDKNKQMRQRFLFTACIFFKKRIDSIIANDYN